MKHFRSRPRDERGTTTLWMLGLVMVLFAVGGIAIDLWNVFSERRSLVAIADAAAAAGASGIDEGTFRSTGVITLDPVRAERLARASIAAEVRSDPINSITIRVVQDRVIVDLSDTASLTLLGIVTADAEVEVQAHATASPLELP